MKPAFVLSVEEVPVYFILIVVESPNLIVDSMENEIKDYDEARVIPSSKLSTQLKLHASSETHNAERFGRCGITLREHYGA